MMIQIPSVHFAAAQKTGQRITEDKTRPCQFFAMLVISFSVFLIVSTYHGHYVRESLELTMSDELANRELTAHKAILMNQLGKPVIHFKHPNMFIIRRNIFL
jgi:hypothetical protein